MTTTPRSDRGFTLIEVLVTVMLLGLVSTVIAAVFVTVIRVDPANEARSDDARSLLGLTNWLPLDVGSTAPEAFTRGDTVTGCDPASVPASQGLLELRWSSGEYPSGTVYVVNYRFVETSPGSGSIYRYSCVAGGTAASLRITAPLRTLASGPSEAPAPVDITLFPLGCSSVCRGLQFDILVLDADGTTQRELLSLDAFTANVVTTLPPTTSTSSTSTTSAPNQAPVAYDAVASVHLDDGFAFELPVADPEGDTLTITQLNDPAELDLTATFDPGDMTVSVVASSTHSPPAVEGQTYQFTYAVSDGEFGSNLGTIDVVVVPTSTSTSTSTSTTTTTTLPPCSAAFASPPASPAAISIKSNGNLQTNLTISIVTNGYCRPLVATFDPRPSDSFTVPEQIAFGVSTSYTIGKNDHIWDADQSSFVFELHEGGSNGPVVSSFVLGVS